MLSGQTLTLKRPLSVEKQTQMAQISGQPAEKTKAPARERPQGADLDARKQRFERRKEAIDWLMQVYPHCFNPKAPLPLKIGIGKEIMDQWVYLSSLPSDRKMPSRTAVYRAMGWYTTRLRYYTSFETVTHRRGLNGTEAGEITEAEKEYARKMVEALKKHHKKRKYIK